MTKHAVPERPVYTLDDLPETGLVYVSEFISTTSERRLIPCTASTWRRQVAAGEAPPTVRFFGRAACRVEHVRALALGLDWRQVDIALLPDDDAA